MKYVDINKYEYFKQKLELGWSYTDIAKDWGVSRQAVCEFCTQQNLAPYKKWKGPRISQRQKNKETFSLGIDMYQVAREKYSRKKQNTSRTNKYQFSIEFEDIEWPTHCPILGIELDYDAPVRAENSVSFDRIDSSKGYEKGNVQILSWRANRIKNDGTAEEHRKIADYMISRSLKSVD